MEATYMNEQQNDFIATELLGELKEENTRKDKLIGKLIRTIVLILSASLIVIAAVVAGFLLYLNQYDFSSTVTQEAEGVYAIVDSEGNVISSDLTQEQLDQLEGMIANGEIEGNSN